MRDVTNIKATSRRSNAGFSPDVWARHLKERIQYAQVQISGAIEALDQILAAAIEQDSKMDSHVTEAAEVLDIARDAAVQVVDGIDQLADAFMKAHDLLAVTQRSD